MTETNVIFKKKKRRKSVNQRRLQVKRLTYILTLYDVEYVHVRCNRAEILRPRVAEGNFDAVEELPCRCVVEPRLSNSEARCFMEMTFPLWDDI